MFGIVFALHLIYFLNSLKTGDILTFKKYLVLNKIL